MTWFQDVGTEEQINWNYVISCFASALFCFSSIFFSTAEYRYKCQCLLMCEWRLLNVQWCLNAVFFVSTVWYCQTVPSSISQLFASAFLPQLFCLSVAECRHKSPPAACEWMTDWLLYVQWCWMMLDDVGWCGSSVDYLSSPNSSFQRFSKKFLSVWPARPTSELSSLNVSQLLNMIRASVAKSSGTLYLNEEKQKRF